MAEVKKIALEALRRESRGCGADFFQRVRGGLIGFGLIMAISWGIRWLAS